jgi:hypothetical protein
MTRKQQRSEAIATNAAAVAKNAAAMTDPFLQAHQYRTAIISLETAISVLVHEQRHNQGWTWDDVGRMLGVSRQAAQQRYGGQNDPWTTTR